MCRLLFVKVSMAATFMLLLLSLISAAQLNAALITKLSSTPSTTTKIIPAIQSSCWANGTWRGFNKPYAASRNYSCKGVASQCYPSCKSGYTGLGPVSWGSCPSNMYQCGVALCTPNAVECIVDVIQIIKDTLETGIALLESDYLEVVQGILNLALDFNYPTCTSGSASLIKSSSFSFIIFCISCGALTFVQLHT